MISREKGGNCSQKYQKSIIGVGGRVARTRDANFLREGGARLEILSSVCLSVCVSVCPSGPPKRKKVEFPEIPPFLRKWGNLALLGGILAKMRKFGEFP